MRFHPNTVRGFILGAIFGTTFGAYFLGPKLVDMISTKVVEQVKTDEELAKAIVRQIPEVIEERAARKPVQMFSEREHHCMAKNIFHEAGVEDREGKVAIGHVTLNRLDNGRWGSDLCSVIYHRAQFSWTLSREKREETPQGPLWEESVRVAAAVLAGERHAALEGVLFYHTDYIKRPVWADVNALVTQIGQHIFYTRALTADEVKRRTRRA